MRDAAMGAHDGKAAKHTAERARQAPIAAKAAAKIAPKAAQLNHDPGAAKPIRDKAARARELDALTFPAILGLVRAALAANPRLTKKEAIYKALDRLPKDWRGPEMHRRLRTALGVEDRAETDRQAREARDATDFMREHEDGIARWPDEQAQRDRRFAALENQASSPVRRKQKRAR